MFVVLHMFVETETLLEMNRLCLCTRKLLVLGNPSSAEQMHTNSDMPARVICVSAGHTCHVAVLQLTIHSSTVCCNAHV